jgi:hypothetical protein
MANKLGEPGQPGKPGEPGEHGGGTGGRGGSGGQGGSAVNEPNRLMWAVVFCAIIAIAVSIGTFIISNQVESNSDKIAKLERQHNMEARALIVALDTANDRQDAAIVLIRQAEYRLCVRQQIVRAAINLDQGHDEPVLPLYDCKPDLEGGTATRLNAKQTKAFEQYVRTAKNLP